MLAGSSGKSVFVLMASSSANTKAVDFVKKNKRPEFTQWLTSDNPIPGVDPCGQADGEVTIRYHSPELLFLRF